MENRQSGFVPNWQLDGILCLLTIDYLTLLQAGLSIYKKRPSAARGGRAWVVRYAFSDAARNCASGSLRLVVELQACMTSATAMTP